MERLEQKIDSVVAALHVLDKKVDKLEIQLTEHDAKGSKALVKTVELETRVSAIENLALVPKKIFDFVWKLSLFVGVVYSIVKFLKP